jgi:gas vesicle protein
MPAGKAIAIAAMPTAVLMGMGFTPTLALADGNDAAPPSNSLTADEYKDCVAALEDAEKDPSASPTPSPSATDGADDGKDDAKEPDPSASTGDTGEDAGTDAGSDQDDPSSPDSGSDDKGAEDEQDAPAPSPSASQSQEASGSSAAEPSPSESEDKGGLLDGLGDTLEGIFTGGKKAEESPSPTPTPSASEGASDASDALKDTTDTVTGTAKDTVEGATGTASKAAEDTADTVDKAAEAARKAAEKAKEDATATPSPSASESADEAGKDAEDCPVATDAEGGVDNKLPLPDDPWYLNASSLLLKGASYKGVVEVRTANGTTKKVLKYVISNGTDIGDLHQTVKDEQAGKTYHVQAAKGSTSTIRDGETVMYTESISGNLLGLIPITFDPENPPPLDIPLIYFTKVTVVQAGQFGGTLHVPGLHQYTTD